MMDTRFTPEMVVEYHLARSGITMAEVGMAPVVILSWSNKLVDSFAGLIQAQPSPHWLYATRNPLYIGQINGYPIALSVVPVGAPGTIMLMEEMVACGAQVFIGLGWAGSLQPEAPVGSLLLPTRCLREEGTSLHYLPDPDAALLPDLALVEKLKQAVQAKGLVALEGPHWTTDAPYRETIRKIDAYRQQGIFGVDMETSAMFALGIYRRVRVANLLVVSDELWQDYRPAFGKPELVQASLEARSVIESCVASGSLHELVGA
jgi:uridine phosphorylase